ncbi:hypothetical protein [Streptomyces sp. NPDC018031]|uniref:hypothetical protein n=1 Tax=Streptomyces sp. NPDC018031 TaxID=3365033 RepID=UPI0037BA6B1D
METLRDVFPDSGASASRLAEFVTCRGAGLYRALAAPVKSGQIRNTGADKQPGYMAD